jgi:hypothetical protein
MTLPNRPGIPTSPVEMLERTRRRAEQMRRRRRSALSAVVAAVVVGAIAVPLLSSGGHHSRIVGVTDEPTSLSTATTAPDVTTTPIVPPTTSPVASTIPAATVPGTTRSTVPRATTTTVPGTLTGCATDQLSAALADGSGAAGSFGYEIVFTNTAAVACTLRGYPGVSYVVGSGRTMVGAPARRDIVDPVVTVTLAPGHTARSLLIETDSNNYPTNTCQLTSVDGVWIYPPNQTAALFVAQSTKACANAADPVLQVATVQPS